MRSEDEVVIEALRNSVKTQGDLVKKLKEANASKVDIQAAVQELKTRKKILEDKEKLLSNPEDEPQFNKAGLEDLCKRRFIFGISFSIYGGVAGLYDYGPVGCSIKANILSFWRSHFIQEEQMLEVDCSIMTPEIVLKHSGHVERFSDVMCKDSSTNEYYRADHVVEAHIQSLLRELKVGDPVLRKEYQLVLEKMDSFNMNELEELMRKYNVVNPETGNPMTDLKEFNLMFGTAIGPSGTQKGFLRPETAQGIFVNFKRLLEFNSSRIPFAAAQIGKSFRNEIHPQSGLIRLREFEMAEIEYFVNPNKKSHPKFEDVRHLKLNLYPADHQMNGTGSLQMNLGDAVDSSIINNESLGYFIGRIQLFLIAVGVNPEYLRFRQHMCTEMAHYATDCWDAEILTSMGWLECVGCADRSCYDLEAHMKGSKVDMFAREELPSPIVVDTVEILPNKGKLGKVYRKDAQTISQHLLSLPEAEALKLQDQISESGKAVIHMNDVDFDLDSEMLTVNKIQKKVHEIQFVPSVIEPSFGIGRILYSVLEHSYRVRPDDEQRGYLSLPPIIAPVKCSVLPLSNRREFQCYLKKISIALGKLGITYKVDDSTTSIGKRYARTDEIGVSFAITVDFDTLKTESVTLRERDTTKQIRISVEDAPLVVKYLSEGSLVWADVLTKYPIVDSTD